MTTTTGEFEHAISVETAAGAHTEGRFSCAVGVGRTVSWARTRNYSSHAVSCGAHSNAETDTWRSHAVALNSYVTHGATTAETSGDDSCAVALGWNNERSATRAHSAGNNSAAFTDGGNSRSVTDGHLSHAISLGAPLTSGDPNAVTSGEMAIAFAPHGVAKSERWFAVGAQVILAGPYSVGVLLPVRYDSGLPVVVTGLTHPVGVRLTLDDEGRVVEA